MTTTPKFRPTLETLEDRLPPSAAVQAILPGGVRSVPVHRKPLTKAQLAKQMAQQRRLAAQKAARAKQLAAQQIKLVADVGTFPGVHLDPANGSFGVIFTPGKPFSFSHQSTSVFVDENGGIHTFAASVTLAYSVQPAAPLPVAVARTSSPITPWGVIPSCSS